MITKKYHFYTAGSIPSIAGIFAGIVVEVDEQRNEIIAVTPLGQAATEPASEAVPSLVPTDPSAIPITSPDIPENKE